MSKELRRRQGSEGGGQLSAAVYKDEGQDPWLSSQSRVNDCMAGDILEHESARTSMIACGRQNEGRIMHWITGQEAENAESVAAITHISIVLYTDGSTCLPGAKEQSAIAGLFYPGRGVVTRSAKQISGARAGYLQASRHIRVNKRNRDYALTYLKGAIEMLLSFVGYPGPKAIKSAVSVRG